MTRTPLPAGFGSAKQIKTSPLCRVYVATEEATGEGVILKCFGSRHSDIARAQREFDTLRAIDHPSVPDPIDLLMESGGATLVLRHRPGVSLDEWVSETPRSIADVLHVAIQLAEILATVHERHLLHRDINPQNVLVDPGSLQTTLVDFGRSLPLGSVSRGTEAAQSTGMPLYTAPEQSGLINHGCDYRSDLYAFGATLYHALCGRPPFPVDDESELLHARLARRPDSPRSIRPDVPEPLAELTLKLLNKEPDDRYQRVQAVLSDLREMLEQLGHAGTLDPGFRIGSADAPDRPRFLPQLYGREREVQALRDVYRSCTAGKLEALWIRGDAGCGKSALIEALRPHVGESGGFLVRGKFDAYQERPYAGCRSVVDALVSQMLMESDAHLDRWRKELREGLGNIAAALVELSPDLGTVLGEVPGVPLLGPRETQARLALAFERFVAVVAQPVHPLVICFDDLHWSDSGSRFLIGELLSSGVSCALLILGTYRTRDGADPGEIAELRDELSQRGVELPALEVRSLDLDSTSAMLADALGCSPADARPLALQIGERMGYRPLLIRQFVEHVHDQGLLRYASEGWVWDLDEVANASIPDSALALLTARLHRLDRAARDVLQFASCMGEEFDSGLLQELGCRVTEGVPNALYRLAEMGLIAVSPGGFRFTHDRLRESARSLLSDEERARLHFETGRRLLSTACEDDDRVFETADHLNRGLEHLTEELRIPAIATNLRAGRLALATGAAANADRYLQVGCRLYRDEDWDSISATGFELHLASAEAALQSGELPRALGTLDGLDARAESEIDVARVLAKRLGVFALSRSPEECLAYALDALRPFGVRWPMHPSSFRARMAMRWTRWKLRGRSGERLLHRAAAPGPRGRAILMVAGASAPARAKVDTNLSGLATAALLCDAVRNGYVAAPAYLLASYATYVQIVLNDYRDARRIADEALDWIKRSPDPVYDPRTRFHAYALLRPWLMPRRSALGPLERVARSFQEMGDAEWANYSRFIRLAYSAMAGDPVPDVLGALGGLAREIHRSKHLYPEPELTRMAYRLLAEKRLSRIQFESELLAADMRLRSDSQSAEPYVRTVWMMVLCVYGRYDLAYAQSQTLGSRLFRVTAYVHVADHTFYRGLAVAALAFRSRGSARRVYVRELDRALRRLQRWAKGGPDFAHMTRLLEAERIRIRGHFGRAIRVYERAIQEADAQSFPHHAAIGAERRGQLLAEMNRTVESLAAVHDAQIRYKNWGARGKATLLKRRLSS